MSETITDPELQEAVQEAIKDISAIVPQLGHHPSATSLALIALGVGTPLIRVSSLKKT